VYILKKAEKKKKRDEVKQAQNQKEKGRIIQYLTLLP
jgi:hypothetical protein